ncbi:MAG: phosphatidylglycerol---prolipoprotein diacylglyceryl transferase [Actinomycetota bacterium]|nr:phosphatidylglycerol---prolipoprotein diacylglyceryl transferase [Actinomycetota bacterium]
MQGLVAAISYNPIVHIPIGPLRISPHGIGIAVGFLLGARLMMPEAERKGIGEDVVYTLLIRAAIGALIGARVAYVLNHFSDYTGDPLGVFKVWQGGISLLGGIFGAIILALPLARKLGVNAWRLLDAAAPGIALGIVVGRIGDLIVADHLGKPTSFFLGYRCPPPDVSTASPCIGTIVHQTALYDLLLTSCLLGLLLLLRRRTRLRPAYDSFLIVVFAAWYGVGRIIEDFLREDVRRFGLTGSQWTAVVTVLLCLAWLTFVRRPPKWGHWDRRLAVADPVAEEPQPTSTMAAPQPQDPEER